MHDPQALRDIEIAVLLEAVYRCYQHDFRDYAPASLRRRLAHAMTRYGCATMSELQHRLIHEPALFLQALQYFTVQVSSMFRDPRYFEALREHAFPVLRTYPSIKLWVAGCSTGEEVWSLAVMLAEEGLLERAVIYATDINPHALQVAEAGIYPLDRMAAFSAHYLAAGGRGSLSDHFTSGNHGAVFDRGLRKQMVFADHSLATDNVFSETHFISCRNVLIYFNRGLQERALGLFKDSLVHRGFLGLGSKETLRFSGHAQDFDACVPNARLYRRRA